MRAADVVLVAAVAGNGVIGRDGDMPWRLPSDLRRFKATTMGRPVVMGRRTFQSIGRALPGRRNIVITRDPGFSAEGIEAARSLDAAVALAAASDADEIMVIGGGEIYAAALPLADRLEITEVHAEPEGDARFPAIDPATWREAARTGPLRGEGDTAEMSFVTYRRR